MHFRLLCLTKALHCSDNRSEGVLILNCLFLEEEKGVLIREVSSLKMYGCRKVQLQQDKPLYTKLCTVVGSNKKQHKDTHLRWWLVAAETPATSEQLRSAPASHEDHI